MITFHLAFCGAVVAVGLLFAGLFRLARLAVQSVKREPLEDLAPDGSLYN